MKNFLKSSRVLFNHISKYRHSIFFLLITTILYVALGGFVHPGFPNDFKTYMAVLVTIDSLVTTSTVSFVAFTNYASTASGSAQVNRKFSWATIMFNSISENSKFNKVKSYFFPETVTLVILSIFITFFDLFTIMFLQRSAILLLLILNVAVSSFILVTLVIKYVIYNKNSYHFTANAIIIEMQYILNSGKRKMDNKELSNDEIDEVKRRARIFAENHLNPLKNSKNDSLIREVSRQINKLESPEGYSNVRMFFSNKIEKDIISSPSRNLHSTMSLYISYKYSGGKIKIKMREFLQDIVLLCPWHEENVYKTPEELDSRGFKKVKSSVLNELMLFEIAHNQHH